MDSLKEKLIRLLRRSERYTKTDMVYLAKGSFWMNLSFVVINGLAFALSIAFARFLPKEIYGTYQFLLSIGSILGALTLTGMNSAIIRAVAQGSEGSFKQSIPVQLKYNFASLAVALGMAVYYYAQGNATLALGVALMGFFIPVFSAFNTYTALISGKKDFVGGFVFSLYLVIPYNLIMFAAIVLFKNPIALVTANFGANCILSIILYFVALRKYRPNSVTDSETISYGKHLSLAGVLGTISSQIDNILVFHYLGTTLLAIYAFASTVPERLNGVLKTIPVMALPKLSERSPQEIQKVALGKSLRYAGLSLVIAIAYLIAAPIIFRLFFPQYLGSVAYSQGYMFALVIANLSAIPLTSLTAMRATKEIYTYNVISPILGIGSMIVLTSFYGIWGLIIGKGLSSLVNYAILIALLSRHKGSATA